jgi:hypothetical protein
MTALTFERLLQSINGKFGIHDIACPLCGPGKHSPQIASVASCVFVVCAGGYVRARDTPTIDAVAQARVSSELQQPRQAGGVERLRKALALWRSHRPLRGTIAETYLRGSSLRRPAAADARISVGARRILTSNDRRVRHARRAGARGHVPPPRMTPQRLAGVPTVGRNVNLTLGESWFACPDGGCSRRSPAEHLLSL